MANNQHLVNVPGQGGGDVVAKHLHAGFQLRRVRTPRGGGIGIVMHEVIGEEFAVFLLEPAKQSDAQTHADNRKSQPRRPMVAYHSEKAISQQANRQRQQRLQD